MLVVPARHGGHDPTPSLASATVLAIASLLPHGLLPPSTSSSSSSTNNASSCGGGGVAASMPAVESLAAPSSAAPSSAAPWPPPPMEALTVFRANYQLLPSVSCWHARQLRPRAECGWLCGAVDEASGTALAPLAHATLTLKAGAPPAPAELSNRDDDDGAGGGGSGGGGHCLGGAHLRVSDRVYFAAAALTPSEHALAAKLTATCRTALTDVEGAGTARWEGSGEWVRSQLHAHIATLLETTSKQMIAGDAARLQIAYGAPWVRLWASTANFKQWVSANRLHAAARLWRARLDADSPAGGSSAAPPASAPALENLKGTVRNASGRFSSWLKQKMPQAAPAARDVASDLLFGAEPPMVAKRQSSGASTRDSFGSLGGGRNASPVPDSPGSTAGSEAGSSPSGDRGIGGGGGGGGSSGGGGSAGGGSSIMYYGEQQHSMPHGRGVLFRAGDKSVYLGEWVRGKEHGIGAELVGTDRPVEGAVGVAAAAVAAEAAAEAAEGGDAQAKGPGQGSGHREGMGDDDDLLNDADERRRSGMDETSHAGAQLYFGSWSDGARHGFGRLAAPSLGVRYTGQWTNGFYHGEGRWALCAPAGGKVSRASESPPVTPPGWGDGSAEGDATLERCGAIPSGPSRAPPTPLPLHHPMLTAAACPC